MESVENLLALYHVSYFRVEIPNAHAHYLHSFHADLENWNGTDRYHFNAIVSDQDFAEVSTFLPLLLCIFLLPSSPSIITDVFPSI